MTQAKRIQWMWGLVTLIGVAVYIAKSLYFAHSALSIGDEGAYLFKGLMFARGEYRPFQEYGFWTNKTPLAFLIPGYLQYWFGAGLREARYFAVGISVLMLAGLWITANRLGGKGWVAIAVWLFALSDAHVATYSLALSQGLVACMMSWMFVCTLGDDRPLWQLVLGSILSVLVVMTRQNMILVPPILILYIFWQYGFRAGLWALGAGVIFFVGFHAVYWPDILQIWAVWLPPAQTPFLDDFRVYGSSTGTFHGADVPAQWQAFAIGLHDHFFILFGAISAVILWVHKDKWKSLQRFKMAVFLGVLYLVLFLMHLWGSVFNDFCALCFTSYQMFFSLTGFLFVLVVFSNGLSDSVYRIPLLAVGILFFSAILGLYYYPDWGDRLLDFVRLPRLNILRTHGQIEFASLREILTYTLQMRPDLQRRAASIGAGVLAGAALLILVWGARRRLISRGETAGLFSTNQVVVAAFLIVGILIIPLIGIRDLATSCSSDFLKHYEQAGRRLAEIIPPDSLVYWKGNGRQLALLLYAEDIRVFPPQITAGGGYLIGDADHLLRFGLYNEELDQQWKQSADIYLIWKFFPTMDFDEFLDQTAYEPVLFEMGELRPCEDPLYVFLRLP